MADTKQKPMSVEDKVVALFELAQNNHWRQVDSQINQPQLCQFIGAALRALSAIAALLLGRLCATDWHSSSAEVFMQVFGGLACTLAEESQDGLISVVCLRRLLHNGLSQLMQLAVPAAVSEAHQQAMRSPVCKSEVRACGWS